MLSSFIEYRSHYFVGSYVMHEPLPEFYKNLPAKRMAAGVLFSDVLQRVLVVKPTYKSGWEIPGGIVELNESPREAAVREIKEELGIEISSERLSLLLVNYMQAGGKKSEAIMFIFDGGILNVKEVENIVPRCDELEKIAFVDSAELSGLLPPVLCDRMQRAIAAKRDSRVAYYEGRYPSK